MEVFTFGKGLVGHGVSPRLSFPVHDADDIPPARRLSNGSTGTVLVAVAEYCGGSPTTFHERGRGGDSRDVAAWLTRRWTTATLRESAESFGLSHPGRVSNLALRRADRAVAQIQPSSPRDRHHPAASGENEERGLTPHPLRAIFMPGIPDSQLM